MGKRKGRNIPTRRSGALKRSENRLDDMIYEVIYLGDALQEAKHELLQASRLRGNSPKDVMLKVRLDMLNYIMGECMKISQEELARARRRRPQEEFKKKVEEWKDKLCPVVILIG